MADDDVNYTYIHTYMRPSPINPSNHQSIPSNAPPRLLVKDDVQLARLPIPPNLGLALAHALVIYNTRSYYDTVVRMADEMMAVGDVWCARVLRDGWID